MPQQKRFLTDVQQGMVPQTLWKYSDVGHTQEAKKELLKYVDFEETGNVLNSVKPSKLLMRLVHIATNSNDNEIVMDFFAGSGPIAHAVLKKNEEDNGNRKFVLVQIPEALPVEERNVKTISDLTKSRIRNVGKEVIEQKPRIDVGFRLLKVDASNMTDIYYSPDELKHDDLFAQIDNIRQDRSAEDLLFQVLLDWGVDLTLPIRKEAIQGKDIFFVDENALVACLDTGVPDH